VLVAEHTQVRQLIDMIAHDEKTKTIATEIIATNKEAKRNLKIALAHIGERMQLLGFMTGSSAGDRGQAPSNRQIKKLQRKV
jgi:alpha-L-arabinofuranosidase